MSSQWFSCYPILCSAESSLPRRGGGCQGTLIFSFTSLHYSSKTPTATSKHLSTSLRTLWRFSSTPCHSFYFPSFTFQYLHCMDSEFNGLHQWLLFPFLSSLVFIFTSISICISPCHHVSPVFLGSYFPFTYSYRLPPSRSLFFSLRISC